MTGRTVTRPSPGTDGRIATCPVRFEPGRISMRPVTSWRVPARAELDAAGSVQAPSACAGGVYTAAGSDSVVSDASAAFWARSLASRRARTTQPTGTAAENSHHWTAYA